MKIVACFEPFAGRRKNRSERAARRLNGAPGIEIVTLPVSFARIRDSVDALFAKEPDVVLLCGESRRAETLLIERVALNLAAANIADNDGAIASGHLDERGPLAREVRFDAGRIAQALNDANIPAATSAHAGTFLCNASLYYALSHPATVAFIHVPADKRRLSAGRAARGLRMILDLLCA